MRFATGMRQFVVLLPLAVAAVAALAGNATVFLPFKPEALQPVPTADVELRATADWLRADATRRVMLFGEMRRQSAEYALALGQRRAEAVARRLRALGISATKIEAVSLGHTGRDGVTLQRVEPPFSPAPR